MSLNALYVDFNAYFASVEQQVEPRLRGKPVGVLPVMAETTCCIAASYEAKALGVTTGTRVKEARKRCPNIIFVPSRPALYVEYHHKLIALVESCTHVEHVLSIDEMVCMLTGRDRQRKNALQLAADIKATIQQQAGEYIRCSIGIAPNIFLAKVASDMQKPDGCVVIEPHELPQRLFDLQLRDLSGIGNRMEARLHRFNIRTVEQLYAAPRAQLRDVWGGVGGEYMYDKLRGINLPLTRHDRRNLGHSHVLPPHRRNAQDAKAVLHRLLQKACMRLRSYDLLTSGISLRVSFNQQPPWQAEAHCTPTDDTLTLTHALETLWQQYPTHADAPVSVGVMFYRLHAPHETVADLFASAPQKYNLNHILDSLNQRYGKNTVYFGGSHTALQDAPMRIAFNHVPDLHTESDD